MGTRDLSKRDRLRGAIAERLREPGAESYLVGSDEAGLGTWAGDLIVVGVAVPVAWSDGAVKDSKALSDIARRAIVRRYRDDASIFKVISRTTPSKIDERGVWTAAICAHNEVHQALASRLRAVDPKGQHLHVVDGFENAQGRLVDFLVPLAKADTWVPAVSLASCFAKVVQCELMQRAASDYPGYGFEKHCGYGTPQHRAALERLGVCPLHRKSYRPIRDLMRNGSPAHRG